MALFITFEGGEGSGKSVQARSLYRRLSQLDISALLIHEPGGTYLGRKISYWLKWAKQTDMSPLTELMLFDASRSQLVEEVIQPNLQAGRPLSVTGTLIPLLPIKAMGGDWIWRPLRRLTISLLRD